MSKVQELQNQYQRNIALLEEILDYEPTNIVMEAALVRFENTVEVSWKFLKAVLRQDYGVECASPKTCIREAYKNDLIPYDETWLALIDKRNNLTHMYDVRIAKDVYNQLPEILPTLKELEHLAKNQESR